MAEVTPPDRPRPSMEALLRGAVTPGATDTGHLADLRRRCWPGDDDRSVRVALRWLSRWGPGRTLALLPRCGCAAGRCGVCN